MTDKAEQENVERMTKTLAIDARTVVIRDLTNTSLTLAEMMALIGRRNTKLVLGFPEGTLRFTEFKPYTDMRSTGPVGRYDATLVYSPLGFPELDDRFTADLSVLFKEPEERT